VVVDGDREGFGVFENRKWWGSLVFLKV
jgi:hypothetical protein